MIGGSYQDDKSSTSLWFSVNSPRGGGGLSTGAELKGIPDIKTSGSPSLFRTSLDRPACF